MAEEQIPFVWKDAVPLDFDVLNEEWLSLKLSDGTTLKVKMVLIALWKSKQQHNPVTGFPLYQFSTQQHVRVANLPSSLRGQPSNQPFTPDLVKANLSRGEVVSFEVTSSKGEWNAYRLSDGTSLRIRYNPIEIIRSPIYGPAGEPLYYITTQPPGYRVSVPKNLIKRVEAPGPKPPPASTYQ